MTDNKDIVQAQVLSQQLQHIEEYIENAGKQVDQIDQVIEALDQIDECKGGEEALLPISNGIFIKGTFGKDKKLLVNVGENTVVEKTIAETKKLLLSQKEEIEMVKQQAAMDFQEVLNKLMEYEEKLKDV